MPSNRSNTEEDGKDGNINKIENDKKNQIENEQEAISDQKSAEITENNIEKAQSDKNGTITPE